MYKFRFIEDPGHGWLEVPLSLLRELRITDRITYFSYLNGAYAYLEEDLDMATFLNAMKESGQDVEVSEVFEDPTAVRGYPSYSPSLLS